MKTVSSPIDLIKKSISIFFEQKNLVFFLKVYLVLIPFALLNYFQEIYLNTQTKGFNLSNASAFLNQNIWFSSLYLIIGLVYLLILFWVGAAGILAVSEVVSGKTPDVKDVFGRAYKKLWPYSLLLIILGFLNLLGLALLIVPGILVLVWYSFAGFELITNDKNVKDSMSASKSLVKGKFWAVLGRIAVFFIFITLCEIAFSIVPYNIGSIIAPVFGALFILPYFLLYKELSG